MTYPWDQSPGETLLPFDLKPWLRKPKSINSISMHTYTQRRIASKQWGIKPSEVIKVRWLNKSPGCIQPQEFTRLPPPKIKTHSKKTEKQIFHFAPESYPSFSHDACQVKWSEGHAVEKMAWSKNVIDLQMCVKYYCRRRGQSAGRSQENLAEWKTHQSEWRAPWGVNKYSNKEHESLHQASVESIGTESCDCLPSPPEGSNVCGMTSKTIHLTVQGHFRGIYRSRVDFICWDANLKV